MKKALNLGKDILTRHVTVQLDQDSKLRLDECTPLWTLLHQYLNQLHRFIYLVINQGVDSNHSEMLTFSNGHKRGLDQLLCDFIHVQRRPLGTRKMPTPSNMYSI